MKFTCSFIQPKSDRKISNWLRDIYLCNKLSHLFLQIVAEVAVMAEAAEKVKASVQKVKDRAQHIVDDIAADKVIAETKLEAAKPALEAAEEALKVGFCIS